MSGVRELDLDYSIDSVRAAYRTLPPMNLLSLSATSRPIDYMKFCGSLPRKLWHVKIAEDGTGILLKILTWVLSELG